MAKMSVAVPEKKDAFSRIVRFMTKADITLQSDEELILDRWIYCDVLLRQGVKLHDEIVQDLCATFSISKFTALNDINQTQRLFERARQASKKYLGHLHIERINQDITRLRSVYFSTYTDKEGNQRETFPDEKEAAALAKFYDTYTKALEALPDEEVADKQPPPLFIFNLAPGQSVGELPEIEDAMAEADRIINMQENPDGVFEAE